MSTNYFTKNYHPPGTPPGTLVGHPTLQEDGIRIHLIDYDHDEYQERELASADECKKYLDKDTITWIHLQGRLQPEMLEKIGTQFGLHPLAMEDVLNKGQRPKIEEYEDHLFIIMAVPFGDDGSISIEQVSIFVGHHYIISFQDGQEDPFTPLRQRLRKQGARIRNFKADYLLYSILDLVVDHGFPILEHFGERIEDIEEVLLESNVEQKVLSEIHGIRRELLALRRNLWPQREILNFLMKGENEFIQAGTHIYLRDCYDHTIQIMDLIENYREMAASMIDVYLSSASHRLNEIMRVLTMIATIFIPLTFVTGLYGMNFSNPQSPWAMPELHWYFGYPLVWGLMIAMVVGMLIYFKRKNWL